MHPERLTHILSLLFLSAKILPEICEHVVFRDYVYTVFGFYDEVVEITFRSVHDVSNQVVDTVLSPILVNAK
jgi:hypothetical protein